MNYDVFQRTRRTDAILFFYISYILRYRVVLVELILCFLNLLLLFTTLIDLTRYSLQKGINLFISGNRCK